MAFFDVASIRADFPILSRNVRNGNRLVYLDNGATSQKPVTVVDAEREFYFQHNAAVHRGAHLLAEEATDAFEGARKKVAEFLGAPSEEIIFTKSATESLNLIAYGFLNSSIGKSDPSSPFFVDSSKNIVVSELEHHANLLPWQQLAERTGAELRWFPVDSEGRLNLSEIESIIDERSAVVALTHQSNVTGAITDVAKISKRVRAVGSIFVLDACQSVPHTNVNVAQLDIDFLAFSGHKALGPTGVGVLWGKYGLLEKMPPMLTGGSMIDSATISNAVFASPPKRFEAGVPNMAQAVGLGAAIDYVNAIGIELIEQYEHQLLLYATRLLKDIPGLRLIGTAKEKASVLSFVIPGLKTEEIGAALNQEGIAVRSGHHCAQPILRRFGVEGTVRPSLAFYNTCQDVDALVAAIYRIKSGAFK
mgnify:CR=1 FL=1